MLTTTVAAAAAARHSLRAGRRRPSWWQFSTTTTTTGSSSSSSSNNNQQQPLLLLLVSRRALLQQKQQHPPSSAIKQQAQNTQHKSSSSTSTSSTKEKPWPRNVVLAFYAACGVFVPYSAAWFLASQEQWRTALLGSEEIDDDDDDDDTATDNKNPVTVRRRVLRWMRRHFGEIDYAAISEPERLESLLHSNSNSNETMIPHKFADEPTEAVRRQQARVAAQNRQTALKVRLHRSSSLEDATTTTTTIVELPAATPANPGAVRRALHLPDDDNEPVALDFPIVQKKESDFERKEAEDDNMTSMDSSADDNKSESDRDIPSLSIYSLWHHHSAPPTQQQANTGSSPSSSSMMSPAQLELSRLDHEIAALQRELNNSSSNLVSSRAIDDIRHDLRQKQSERRRWQVKRWLGR